MNVKLVGLLAFISGGSLGYWLASKVLEDKYEALMREEIDEFYAFQREKAAQEAENSAGEDSEEKTDGAEEVKPAKSALVRSSLNPYEKAKELHGITHTYPNISEDDSKIIIDAMKPFFIDEEEFKCENDRNEKADLYFYTTDGILADDEDNEVDIEYTIGGKIYDTLTAHPASAWVRNPKSGTDFQIGVVDGPYPYGNDDDARRRRHEE